MKTFLSLFCTITVFLFASSTIAQNKVVVIPLNTTHLQQTDKLLGKGRPGTKLLPHTDPNGYCTSDTGIKYALSYHLVSWADVAEACTAGTWVCRISDLPTDRFCNIEETITIQKVGCDGTKVPEIEANQDKLTGYFADADTGYVDRGMGRLSSSTFVGTTPACEKYRVWCCWE